MTSRVTTFVLAMAIILGHARAVRLPDSGHMHHWVVHVPGGVKEAHAVATQHGLKNHGQVKSQHVVVSVWNASQLTPFWRVGRVVERILSVLNALYRREYHSVYA